MWSEEIPPGVPPIDETIGLLSRIPREIFLGMLEILLALLAGWIIWRLTRRVEHYSEQAINRTRPDQSAVLVRPIRRIIRIGGAALAATVVLAMLGVNLQALATTLGLTSVALGFALKDTIEQAVTGVFLLFQRPFNVGDIVEIEGVEGIVHDVDIRTTNIRTFDGLQVLIPNNKVYQAIIRNKSFYGVRRWQLVVGVGYDTDLQKAHRAFFDAVSSTPGVQADPAPLVSFEGFDPSSIRCVIRFWMEPAKTDILATQTAIIRSIKDAARREGIDIPLPSQTLIMKQVIGGNEVSVAQATAPLPEG